MTVLYVDTSKRIRTLLSHICAIKSTKSHTINAIMEIADGAPLFKKIRVVKI